MSDNIDFKNLWKKQESTVPSVKELVAKINSVKIKTRNQLIFKNILLALTIGWIMFIVIHFKPEMITTKIGSMLIVVAIIIVLINSSGIIRSLTEIKKNDTDLKNYLIQLIAIREKQKFVYNTLMKIYFALLSVGIFLYMIEYCNRMSLTGKIIAYSLTASWILFVWFYLRKKAIAREKNRMDEVITQLERINAQFEKQSL